MAHTAAPRHRAHYIFANLLGGVDWFVLSFFTSVGLSGFLGFGTLVVLRTAVTLTAYRAIRRRDITSHQTWMIRSFALSFAALTLRLWLFALLLPR